MRNDRYCHSNLKNTLFPIVPFKNIVLSRDDYLKYLNYAIKKIEC